MNNVPFFSHVWQAIQDGKLEDAQSVLKSMLYNKPENRAEIWYLLSHTYHKPQEIAACLRQALKLRPDYPEAKQRFIELKTNSDLKPLIVMRVGFGSAAAGTICPFCKSSIKSLEEVVTCPQCGLSHHYECWSENNSGCAGAVCDGFSIEEIFEASLPLQPPPPASRTIIIRKEDIRPSQVIPRMEKEKEFLCFLLQKQDEAEAGLLPPGLAAQLPDREEIMQQLIRDVKSEVVHILPLTELLTQTTDKPTQLPKNCIYCGQEYPRVESRFCKNCGKPRPGGNSIS
jgi:hypothetical protein